MARDFSTTAEISLTLAPGEARAIRDELEGELGGLAVGTTGAAGALGAGAGGGTLADGGIDHLNTIAALQQDQLDVMEDLLEEAERGGLGGAGGGGGGLDPLSLLLGRSLAGGGGSGGAGLLSRLTSSGALKALATGGAAVTGGVAAPPLTRDMFSSALGQDGPSMTRVQGADEDTRAPLSPFNFLDAGKTFFGRPDAPTDSELPGNITRETIRRNRADERRQQTVEPTVNVGVTVEQARQSIEQAMRDAKRQAAREVAQEVNKNLGNTTSRTGL